MSIRKSRKIVLLSDGTGNSSIARDKSNVWRIYTSLELGSDVSGEYEQVAFYDDGVGTSGFRPLRLLGGVFGVGLSRNLRQLYAELCRHYQPGDQVYIFGFSRGAFTARILAHFIEICGIVDTSRKRPGRFRNLDDPAAPKTVTVNSEDGFARTMKDAYKSYRRSYWQRSTEPKNWRQWILSQFEYALPRLLTLPSRFFRSFLPGGKIIPAHEFKKLYGYDLVSEKPVIEFLGVWDTVDAFGLPIDELSDFVDRWLYPYQFKNRCLGQGVARAAHAIAIDDERHTFHPLLWEQKTQADKERILQVWFAGMHSDLGGGYPEDNLAYISLCWMIEQACGPGHGLKFDEQKIRSYEKQRQAAGVLHNSRRGLGVLYRYKPRNIYKLCENTIINPQTSSPAAVTLHHSVLDRIRGKNTGYSPAGIPRYFHVYDKNGEIDYRQRGSAYYEAVDPMVERGRRLSKSEDYIAWGRFAYFCMLATFLYLLAFPVINPPIHGLVPSYDSLGKWQFIPQILDKFIGFLESDLTQYWTDAWRQDLNGVGIAVVVFMGFRLWRWRLSKAVSRYSEEGWSAFRRQTISCYRRRWFRIFLSLSHRIRTSRLFLWLRSWFARTLFPLSFFALLLFVIAMPVSRFGLTPLTDKIDPCKIAQAPVVGARLALNEFAKIAVNASSPCITANIDLDAGRTYEVTVTDIKDWSDNGNPIAGGRTYPATLKGLDGIFTGFRPGFIAGMLVRRNLTMPWFALTGEIGRDSGHVFPINKTSFTFKPIRSGPLYIYVNDALKIYGDKNWWEFYDNNTGTATLMIKRVE